MVLDLRFITADEIYESLLMSECIEAMESLYLNEAGNLAKQPLRSLTRIDSDTIILTMPSYSAKLGRFAVKIVSEYRNNPTRFRLPVQGGIIVLIDGESSKVLS